MVDSMAFRSLARAGVIGQVELVVTMPSRIQIRVYGQGDTAGEPVVALKGEPKEFPGLDSALAWVLPRIQGTCVPPLKLSVDPRAVRIMSGLQGASASA